MRHLKIIPLACQNRENFVKTFFSNIFQNFWKIYIFVKTFEYKIKVGKGEVLFHYYIPSLRTIELAPRTGDFRNWGWGFFWGWTTREIVREKCPNISSRKYFGGTGVHRDGSLLIYFFMLLFATEFEMVKYEETKRTEGISWTLNCRSWLWNKFQAEYILTLL